MHVTFSIVTNNIRSHTKVNYVNRFTRNRMDMKTKPHKFSGLFLLLLLALADVVHAQQSCEWRPQGPLGPAWYQPGGLSACSNNIPQQPAEPPVRWSSRWGAVAVDNHTGDAGTITGQPSASDARRIALQRCGSKGCEVKMEYHNQCAAIAWGTKVYNASSAATIEEASERAMRLCSKDASDCEVILAECSLPERIQ